MNTAKKPEQMERWVALVSSINLAALNELLATVKRSPAKYEQKAQRSLLVGKKIKLSLVHIKILMQAGKESQCSTVQT